MNQKTIIAILVILILILTGATLYFATSQKQIAPNQPIVEKNNIVPAIDQNTITEQDMKSLYLQMKKELPNYVADAGKDYEFKIFAKNGRYLNATLISKSKELFSRPHFSAYKAANEWKIIFSGQDLPNCDKVNALSFPNDIIPTCFDGTKSIQR